MKKFLITALLLLTLLCTVSAVASAHGFELNLSELENVEAGQTITVVATADNITVDGGIESIDFMLRYNENVTYSAAAATLPTGWSFWGAVSNTTARTVKIGATDEGASPNPAVNNGDVTFTFTFVVDEGFVDGDTITIEFVDKIGASAAGTYQYVEGLGDKIDYYVQPNVPEYLTITSLPRKTEYTAGSAFCSSGLAVSTTYTDGTVVDVTSEIELIIPDMMTEGVKVAIVKWGNLETSFEITITAPLLSSITVTPPTITSYYVGDTLNTAGMVVIANYANNTTADVTADATVTPMTLTAAGTVTVTVKYSTKSSTFTVTVIEKPVVTEITVGAPTKTSYTVGDTLDTTGMTVTANYSDGSTADVTAKATVDTTTLSTAGTVTVTVTYEGFTDTFTVTVTEKSGTNIAEGTIGGTVTWAIESDGTLRISGTGAIPNYERNKGNDGPWYPYKKNVKAIVVEDGITSIGNYAFYNLTKATTIDIAHSVEFIGQSFIRQTGITEITIDWDVRLQYYVFGRADNLKTIIFTEDAKDFAGNLFNDYAFSATIKAPEGSFAHKYTELYPTKYPDCADTVSLTFESTGDAVRPIVEFTAAGTNAFFAIYQETTGYWTLEVTGRGEMKNFPYISDRNAAKGYTFCPMHYIAERGTLDEQKIRKVVVGDDITTIGNYAFYKINKCSSLKFPDTITFIGNGAFWNFVKLKTFTVPETVTEIGKHAFNGCANLTSVIIPDTVQKIGEDVFTKCNFTKLVVYTKNQIVIDRLMSDKDAAKINIVTEY